MKYRLYLDTNHRQMDTSARTLCGEFDAYELATASAREIVDGVLDTAYERGMTASALLEAFQRRGEYPFILPDDINDPFDAREYAAKRCAILCGGR